MFICSCNGLTDKDIHAAVDAGATRPQEVYAAKKCRARCGNCVPGVVCMLRQALRDQKALVALSNAVEMADRGGHLRAVA
ncbi:(2Fe-2S)-binding protein [Acetobacter oeni]|uniref:Bacterioferritin-associated ferredoxin n=1 Tax=Acetobacter oeni TaxID=304077 RepID=A0A511XN84_9PROT|nr:(2Fe-2S)-binding protein [Acetobacter oeni]MBB3884234.1 bacterioferritin-associated ferredoxin [Acetobacter oeni]GBR05627.1 bacterioferritin-associated ferredoxin [Acetobacter oeni LMG 21952]GEN64385.1 bacterioferritin-associated ferredoxin [Acetobacter oeni]